MSKYESQLPVCLIIKTDKCQTEQMNTYHWESVWQQLVNSTTPNYVTTFYYYLEPLVYLHLLYMFGGTVMLNGLLPHLSLQCHSNWCPVKQLEICHGRISTSQKLRNGANQGLIFCVVGLSRLSNMTIKWIKLQCVMSIIFAL